MTKKIDIGILTTIGTIGTQDKVYKSTGDLELFNNSGTLPVRMDKVMVQATGYHTGTVPWIGGVIVHISDETGAALSASIADGTTDLATLEVLLNQWKDNVFMTDFRYYGTGNDESVLPALPLEADTRRILKPGQKLLVTTVWVPRTAETSKSGIHMIDSMLWYSAAAQ